MKSSFVLFFLLPTVIVGAEKPPVINVWPGNPPGETKDIPEEGVLPDRPGQRKVQRITNVSKPTLTIYRPAKEKDTGAAVLICPGGGYHILAWDLEGVEVAKWLNSIGVTGVVLKYRVPRRPGQARDKPPVGPLQDAQRALSLTRSNAKKWGIDKNRLGILGFSAGGHLSASTSTNYDKRSYEPIDVVDKESCRPDFTVLIYPAYLAQKNTIELKPDIRVTPKTPPMFLVHAANDRLSPKNSIALFLALKDANVPSELHVYTKGGHGFGLRPSDDPVSTWPARCAAWLKSQGFLKR